MLRGALERALGRGINRCKGCSPKRLVYLNAAFRSDESLEGKGKVLQGRIQTGDTMCLGSCPPCWIP